MTAFTLAVDALGALPNDEVDFALWIPSATPTLPGYLQGAWGPWQRLPGNTVVSVSAADTRKLTSGGDEFLLACTVYCAHGYPVELIPASERSAKVRYAGAPGEEFRVMNRRVWGNTSDHLELQCERILREATTA